MSEGTQRFRNNAVFLNSLDVAGVLTTTSIVNSGTFTTDSITTGSGNLAIGGNVTAVDVTASGVSTGNTVVGTVSVTAPAIVGTNSLTAPQIFGSTTVTGLQVVATNSVTAQTVSASTSISAPAVTATTGLTVAATAYSGASPATFNPNMTDESSGGPTYANQQGYWQTIGNVTFVMMHIQWATKGTVTGTEQIRVDLPVFAHATWGYRSPFLIVGGNGLGSAVGDMVGGLVCANTNADYMLLSQAYFDGSANTNMIWNDLSAAGWINISGWYFSQ